MDINEKIQLFQEMVVEGTEESVDQQLEIFEASLQKILDDHIQEKTRKDHIILATEKENIRKERNKQISQMHLQMQRDLHKQQQQLKKEVFNQVEKNVANFKQTEEYVDLLEEQINSACEIAKGKEIILYIDPSDADKIATLEERTGQTVIASTRSFIGGVRGVIHSRNMLIDYSFLKKLETERVNFSFDFSEEEDKN